MTGKDMSGLEFAVELAGMLDSAATSAIIRDVESLGYSTLWWCDFRFYRDVYSLLTQTALKSETLRFGTFVTDPYARHPALTAAAIATVAELSEGRAVLGFGAGVSGLREMGIERRKPAKSISEAIDLMRALWTGEHVEFHGETVSFDGQLEFAVPQVPVFVASNSPMTLAVAGAKGDGVIVEGLRTESMHSYVEGNLERGCSRVGRNSENLTRVARLDLCISDDRTAALDVLRERVQHYVSVHGASRWAELAEYIPPQLESEIRAAGFTHDHKVVRQLADKIPFEAVPVLALGGTEEDVADQLAEVRKLGVNQVSIFPIPSERYGITVPDLIRRFGNVIKQVGYV